MPFFTRPDLSDIEFRQLTGATLTMSGTTDFVGILKSKGVEIDATISGATTGDTLSWDGTKISLSSGSNQSLFNGNRTTTRSGIPQVNAGSTNVNGFLEKYFFPDVPPSAAISGGGTRSFGNNAIVNLSYTATRNTLPITSIKIDGNTVPLTNGGNTQSGVSGKTLTANNTNQTFTLAVKDSNNVTTNATTSVVFNHRRYFYGDNTNLIGSSDATITTNVNLHSGGTTSEFSTTRVKSTFSITLASQFFYYVIPSTFGTPVFTINGLQNNDFSSQSFTLTNTYGFATTFVLWRQNNLLTGTFNISVA